MDSKIRRRTWIAGLGALASLPVGRWLFADDPPPEPRSRSLRSDPRGVLDLREGFRYRILERSGAPMDDGRPVPPRPDGMACFAGPDGALILMRNHELPVGWTSGLLGSAPLPHAYDPAAPGGVTRLVLDAQSLARRGSNTVLAGTSMNCSGGASPWGWLSCEEDHTSGMHGYVFVCDPLADRVSPPRRIRGYGRFRHEAAAVDEATAITYLSEDQGDGALYRFVPHDPSRPFEGRLQALAIAGRPREDTSPWRRGEQREYRWIDLDDPDPAQHELRYVARERGAASFRRGEGLCFGNGQVHLCASTGGPIEGGQIFRLQDEPDGGTLHVLASSTDRGRLDMPDNVTLGPAGLVFFVEDGLGRDYVRAIRPDGTIVDLGRNAASEGEIAGVCFSPDGRAMFLNLQEDGLTIAVEGPFGELA